MNVFIRHLGEQYANLSELIKQAHIGDIKLTGNVTVRQGNFLARMLCKILKMPSAGESVQLVVHGRHGEHTMHWSRSFAGHDMDSCFREQGDYLVEKMGPISLCMKMQVIDSALHYQLFQARLWGVPLPAILAPQLEAAEMEQDGGYYFYVRIGLPFIGNLIGYSGCLSLESPA